MTVVGLHPEDLFDKMLEGELTPPESERLHAHLDACEVCRFEYRARLDFQTEALDLAAMRPPPALPLRPFWGVQPTKAPRRRRTRLFAWGLAAAALITASGAVASGLVTSWYARGVMFSPIAASARPPSPALVQPAVARVGVAAPAPLEALPVAEAAAALPVVEAAPLQTKHDARPRDAAKLPSPSVAAVTQLTAPPASTGDMPAPRDAATKEPASAAKLFGEANQARRSGDVGRAAGLYRLLQDQFPGSPEADLSRVTLALLLLDNGDAQGALTGFERYLASSSRGLEAEALVGRARALGRLGRRELETAAWREVQRKYPRSIYGRQAGERLTALGRP